MIIYIFLLFFMTLLGATASLFLKKSSGSDGIVDVLKDIHLYVGGFLYMTSAILNIFILHYLEYSVVLPLTALTYVWTMLLSRMFLGERITYKKTIGVILILIGAICVSI